MLGARKGQDGG